MQGSEWRFVLLVAIRTSLFSYQFPNALCREFGWNHEITRTVADGLRSVAWDSMNKDGANWAAAPGQYNFASPHYPRVKGEYCTTVAV